MKRSLSMAVFTASMICTLLLLAAPRLFATEIIRAQVVVLMILSMSRSAAVDRRTTLTLHTVLGRIHHRAPRFLVTAGPL